MDKILVFTYLVSVYNHSKATQENLQLVCWPFSTATQVANNSNHTQNTEEECFCGYAV